MSPAAATCTTSTSLSFNQPTKKPHKAFIGPLPTEPNPKKSTHLEACRGDDLVSRDDLPLAVDLIVTVTTTAGALIPARQHPLQCQNVATPLCRNNHRGHQSAQPLHITYAGS
jgi:hypothetical protein